MIHALCLVGVMLAVIGSYYAGYARARHKTAEWLSIGFTALAYVCAIVLYFGAVQ